MTVSLPDLTPKEAINHMTISKSVPRLDYGRHVTKSTKPSHKTLFDMIYQIRSTNWSLDVVGIVKDTDGRTIVVLKFHVRRTMLHTEPELRSK